MHEGWSMDYLKVNCVCEWSYWLQSVMLLTKHNTQLLSLNMMEGLSRISGMVGMLEWLDSHKYYHLPLSKYKLKGLQLWIFINVILESLSWLDSEIPELILVIPVYQNLYIVWLILYGKILTIQK